MVLGDGEAYFGVCFEPAVFVHEHDVWRFEGILIREEDLAVVYALVEFGVLRALDGEVPGVDVVGQGLGLEVAQLFLGEFLGLAHDALLADVRRSHLACKLYTSHIIANTIVWLGDDLNHFRQEISLVFGIQQQL